MTRAILVPLFLVLLITVHAAAQPVEEIEGVAAIPAGRPVDIFVTEPAPPDWLAEEASDPNGRPVVRQRVARFNGTMPGSIFSTSRATPFEFHMKFMDGLVERVVIERVEVVTRDGVTLRQVQGRVKSDDLSRINLVFTTDQVRGAVHYDGTYLELRPVDSNLSVIQWIDPSRFPREEKPRAAHRQPGFVKKETGVGLMLSSDMTATPLEPFDGEPYPDIAYEPPEIRVLVVWSDDHFECTTKKLNQAAQTYETALNTAFDGYATSSIEFQCIPESETWTTSEEARQFLMKTPSIKLMRKNAEADLVVMLLKDGLGSCGYAAHPVYPFYPIDMYVEQYAWDAAFAIVDEACVLTNFSFEHEIGHLLGMQHERFSELGGVSDFCGYGYPVTRGGKPVNRTIMSYDSYCTYLGTTCDREQYYSIPRKKAGGLFGWLSNMLHKCFGKTKGKSCDATGVHDLDKSANDLMQIIVAAGDVATYSEQPEPPP